MAGDTGDDGKILEALPAQNKRVGRRMEAKRAKRTSADYRWAQSATRKRNGFHNTQARAVVPGLQKQAPDIKKILSEPTALTALLFACNYKASVVESNSWYCRDSQIQVVELERSLR